MQQKISAFICFIFVFFTYIYMLFLDTLKFYYFPNYFVKFCKTHVLLCMTLLFS